MVVHRARQLGLTDSDLDALDMDAFLAMCEVHMATVAPHGPRRPAPGEAPPSGQLTPEEFLRTCGSGRR